MTVADLIVALTRMDACGESITWLRTLPPESSAYSAWRSCERGDWLVWLVTHADVRDHAGDRALRLIACDCAEQAVAAGAAARAAARAADLAADLAAAWDGQARIVRRRVPWATVRDALAEVAS